ncbi:MAG TPA: hypothetical protein VFA65_13465 [Bryobacteraceae bacterium]|nr:hypothetical protein [Bryobacteraceae bacterium]
MSSQAQIDANRENAQHSTGPSSEAGKAASSQNAVRHGLSGHIFSLLEWEDAEDFDRLQQALRDEHQPVTPTEHILVEKMVQCYWLSQRAQSLQTSIMTEHPFSPEAQNELTPYLRYQAHYERLFQRALKDLLTLRAEKRKEQIGFVSQQAREAKEARSQAAEIRRESDETRKQEQHSLKIAIAKKRLEREEADAMIRAVIAAEKMERSLSPQKGKMAA